MVVKDREHRSPARAPWPSQPGRIRQSLPTVPRSQRRLLIRASRSPSFSSASIFTATWSSYSFSLYLRTGGHFDDMASRRILPHRNARATPTSTSQVARPRSAASRSDASSRSRLATPVDERFDPPPLPPTAKQEKPKLLREDVETNIQVVLRCRRRSDREIQENSPIIVSTTGAKSTELTIQTAAPSTSLGLVTMAAPRKYPFDTVFGPEADQAMIYDEVVSPMLDEIVKGYNCTLFAYGQTGTGKT